MGLRPYQTELVDAAVKSQRGGSSRDLAVLPTGGGKTRCFSHLAKLIRNARPDKKVLVIVHLDKLVWQCLGTLQEVNPSLHVDIDKAQYRRDPNADIVVASVQTVGRSKKREDGTWDWGKRLSQYDPNEFGCVVVDEAHHATGSSYAATLRYFGCYKPEPEFNGSDISLLGVTATPNRTDQIGLEYIFDKIIYPLPGKPYGLSEMIRDKWLVYPSAHRVDTQIDISEVKRGDDGKLNTRQLERKVNTPERNALIVKEYKDLGQGQRGLAFTVDIQHSEDLAKAFNEAGIRAFALSSNTPENDRKTVYQLFKDGYYRVLCSAKVLLEGFDEPQAMVAMMCNPTESTLIYQQSVGRTLRPFPSPEDMESMYARGETPEWIKPYAIILDFVDVTSRHRLVTLPTLFGLRPDFNLKGKNPVTEIKAMEEMVRQKKLPISLEQIGSVDELKSIIQNVDLLAAPVVPELAKKHSKFAWMSSGIGSFQLCLPEYAMIRISENTLGQWEVSRSVKGIRTPLGTHRTAQEAFAAADRAIPPDAISILSAEAKWRSAEPTDKQLDLLYKVARHMRQGFTSKEMFCAAMKAKYTKGDVSNLISTHLSNR